MKKVILMLLALGLIAGIAVPSYSAVQNVQVGGDLTIYGAYRHDFDMRSDEKTNDFLQTSARIWVSANLSDKVSAMIRIINERDWGQTYYESYGSVMPVTLDLAYVKLADMFTPGLDLTVGRQNLKIGQGFVIGNQYWFPYYYSTPGYPNPLLAPDLGLQTSFDAIKVDYKAATAPLSIQGFMAKINENPTAFSSTSYDLNLYGVSALYAPENWSLEPYIVNLYNYGPHTIGNIPNPSLYDYLAYDNLSTAGIRGTLDVPSVKGLSFKAEYARQFGKITTGGSDYDGWAGYVGGEYKFQAATNPYILAQYAMYSGNSASSTHDDAFVLVFPSDIADNVGLVAYAAGLFSWHGAYGLTGLKAAKLGLGFQPTDKLGVSLNWFNLALAESQGAASDSVGNEIDLAFKYAYSEDVGIGLDLGTFARGDVPKASGYTENPWEAVASLKLAF